MQLTMCNYTCNTMGMAWNFFFFFKHVDDMIEAYIMGRHDKADNQSDFLEGTKKGKGKKIK